MLFSFSSLSCDNRLISLDVVFFSFLSGHVVELLRPQTRKEREAVKEVIGMNGPAVQSQVVCGSKLI